MTSRLDPRAEIRAADDSDALAMADRLRLSATRLARRLRQESGTDLTPSQLAALASIDRHGPLTLGTLAEVEQVAPPSITKVVAKLEAAELVVRRADDADRRVAWVSLTPAGATRLARIRRLRSRVARDPTRRARPRGARAARRRARRARRARGGHAMRRRMQAATRDTFRSLRSRNFRLFFGGQLISQVGNWLTLVAQTLLVLTLTNSGVALGALAAAQFGPVLLLGPWAGLVADRSDKRRLLLVVQAVAMLQSFTLAALAFSGSPPVWSIYLVALVGGVTVAFDNPARRAFVDEMVDEEDVQNAVSLNSALMTSSRVVGPALAGLLVATVGFGWCFLSDGLSYVAVLWALWRMRPADLRRPPVTPKAKRQIREGLRYARRRARAVGPARDDGGRRDALVQLPDRVPAVRHPRPAR